MECEMAGCEKEATFELHVPWTANERVCAGHARVRSRQDGVVADPLDSAEDELPGGAANSGNR
ncbi:MAG: hypothetical protein V5A43_04450 [Haloarculaceae archaeon]